MLLAAPANHTFGLHVTRAVDGTAEVDLPERPALVNVIGSAHASVLIALIDATGLAAIISAATAADQLTGVIALGAAATLHFHAPARGLLRAHGRLTDTDLRDLQDFYRTGSRVRHAMATDARIYDHSETVVCEGRFQWSIRRRPS